MSKRARVSDVNGLGLSAQSRVFWLECGDERYVLVEDTDSGDILMPLIYMKVSGARGGLCD